MENPILQRQTRTILQQIEELKNWHKQQQTKLDTSDASIDTETVPKLRSENIKYKNVPRPQFEKSPVTQQNFDEIPIKVANPNFNKVIENNINPNTEGANNSDQNGVKPKFRFLKRGEGIARFRMGPQKAPKVKSKNVWTLNLSGANSKTSENEPNSVKDPKLTLNEERPNIIESDKVATLNPPDLKLDFKNWRSIFDSGKAEELFEKAISNNQLDLFQPDSSVDSSTASIMERFIAVGKKHLKERHELNVFETIEQHLLDSSFCSTSSYVARLMENAVISTPIKKTFGNKNEDLQAKTSLLPTVVIENEDEKEEVTNKENTVQSRPQPAVWINTDSSKQPDPKPQEADDLEHSMHVRFNEVVDYKSFVEYSQSLNGSNPNVNHNVNKEMNESEEWKEDSGEDSVCCSECSTSYSSSDEDVEAIAPLGKPPQGLRNSLPKLDIYQKNKQEVNRNSIYNKLDVADLKSKEELDQNKTGSSNDVGLDKLPPVLGLKVKELECEIETFRKENNKLKALREALEKERKYFQTEKKKFLLEFEEEKKKNAVQLEQEKQKLSKEKLVFEKYSKSLSKNPSKEERKEIQAVREQLTELKEEMNKKESRWGAAQARVRNQVKVLEEDNKKLREEVEVLRKQAKHLEFLTHKKTKPFNNTKLIHAINELVSNTPIEEEGVAKSLSGGGYFDPNPSSVKSTVVDVVNPKNMASVKVIKENKLPTVNGECSNKKVEELYKQMVLENEPEGSQGPSVHASKQNLSSAEIDGKYKTNNFLVQSETTQNIFAERVLNSPKELIKEDGTVEKIYPDGKKEIKYKNGNIKKIDPFSGNEKIIYFNGDVKENLKDGTVKYYFSESRIWHTTLPDGLEVLDFPNGQVEKRHTNGMVEIIYPNDCKKLTFPDGTEELLYADGTKLKIESDKRKILSLPNGQREIHTEECFRREYPDGTVKIVYPDGVAETIYANGRVRLKDKHGNLVMDSAKSTYRL